MHQPKYEIAVPGVFMNLINSNEIQNPELIKQLEHQNNRCDVPAMSHVAAVCHVLAMAMAGWLAG